MINAIRLKSAREALGMETFVLPETGERQLPSEEEKELAEIVPSRKGVEHKSSIVLHLVWIFVCFQMRQLLCPEVSSGIKQSLPSVTDD